jgi:hypothetical protein
LSILGIISILEIILRIISILEIILGIISILEILSSRITEAPEHYTYHGDEKSGSGVLLRVHSIGVDYELRTKLGSLKKT